MSRFHVEGQGVSLAVSVDGQGRPIVFVHGSLWDHTEFDPLVAELRDDMAALAMDRRGYGESSDAPAYSIEAEFADVAAVVDAVATRTHEQVVLLGHSYGADCAMGGAALTSNVFRLLLYEPGLGIKYPIASIEAMEQAVSVGDMEAAAQVLLVDIMEKTEEEFKAMRASPEWPRRLASVPLVPRELRTEEAWTYQPGQFDAIMAPTLMLTGSESSPVMQESVRRAAAAIPNAEMRLLPGQSHSAVQTDPAVVAGTIREFSAS